MAKIPRPGEAIFFYIDTQATKNKTQWIITMKHKIFYQQSKIGISLLRASTNSQQKSHIF